MNKLLIFFTLLIMACKSDHAGSGSFPEVDAAIKLHMASNITDYKFGSALVTDTIFKGELAILEIEALDNEITAHNAKINQERLNIDIHAHSPNPAAFAQDDKSSLENIEFYKKLIVRAAQRITRLRPWTQNKEQMGLVVLHRFSRKNNKGTERMERFIYLSPDLEVLLIHREDRHDIRTAVFEL